jgi:hypothetical protein
MVAVMAFPELSIYLSRIGALSLTRINDLLRVGFRGNSCNRLLQSFCTTLNITD